MAADALSDPPSVSVISERLRGVLQRAREIKVVDTIDPPLPIADLAQDVSSLGKHVFASQPDAHKFTVVEAAARKIFYQTIVRLFALVVLSGSSQTNPLVAIN
jgi:THO complex subunit 1